MQTEDIIQQDLVADEEQVKKVLEDATNVLDKAFQKSKEGSVLDKAGDILTEYRKEIQSLLDTILFNKVATKQQLSELEEKTRLAKLQMLEAQSKNTTIKYLSYAGIIVVVFGTLWFLTRKKMKNEQ